MGALDVAEILEGIRACKPYTVGDLSPPMILRSSMHPAVNWSPSEVESVIDASLPKEMSAIWEKVSSIQLWLDSNYGQWGCALWSPAETIARHEQAISSRGVDEFRRGDLIVGEFVGDPELVILRCDPSADDFGSVVIALAMDPREDWPCVARSIGEFILKYLARPARKFWEPETKETKRC